MHKDKKSIFWLWTLWVIYHNPQGILRHSLFQFWDKKTVTQILENCTRRMVCMVIKRFGWKIGKFFNNLRHNSYLLFIYLLTNWSMNGCNIIQGHFQCVEHKFMYTCICESRYACLHLNLVAYICRKIGHQYRYEL